MTPVVAVAGIVFDREGRVLLVERGKPPGEGQWSVPGGRLVGAETLAQGVAREVLEETSLVVAVGPALDVFDRIMLDPAGRVQYHFVLVDYLCTVVSGRPRAGSDVTAVAVADPERLAPYHLTDKALEIIGKAIDHVV